MNLIEYKVFFGEEQMSKQGTETANNILFPVPE